MNHLLRNIDRLFDDLVPSSASRQTASFAPACDVEETDTHYLLSFDLPGVRKEDVKIELKDSLLSVAGERSIERESRSRHFVERAYGTFFRSFQLPSDADADGVQAEYKDGVLGISIPKAARAKPRQIEIRDWKSDSPRHVA